MTVVAITVLLAALWVIRSYYKITSSERKVLQNLKYVNTASCYIYLKIRHKNEIQTVVCPNDVLFYALERGRKLFFHNIYVYTVGKAIQQDEVLEVDDQTFDALKIFIVDMSIVRKYEKQDLLNDNTILRFEVINPELDWENRKALAYQLLLTNTNCCSNSEGGLGIIDVVK